ncbi:uncharacterized protein EV154DRAFT_476076 [Mucor mucedo]|uniref:uncharacterized protein n=1 Tax=Mucor mucedo TaxID=29922 RepID=UPI00221E4900|nr:uncharacterized protein EV154DRAFT_476076 [Mucor mucedo]KAI7896854.1 hypothetical protein EV154DRAFT_476076 [Mucor mucedo]
MTRFIIRMMASDLEVDPLEDSYDEDLINIDLPSKYEKFDIKHGPIIKDDSSFDCTLGNPRKMEKLEAIFLVGGFWQSSYLFGKIKANCSQKFRLICQPESGQPAIVCGVVLMGLNPSLVKQRVIRRTYGYQYAMEYDDEKDKGRPKVMYENGKTQCNGRFHQYAKKGDIQDIRYYSEAYFTISYDNQPSIHLFAYDGDINNKGIIGVGNIKTTHSQYERSTIPEDSGKIGIQGTILE